MPRATNIKAYTLNLNFTLTVCYLVPGGLGSLRCCKFLSSEYVKLAIALTPKINSQNSGESEGIAQRGKREEHAAKQFNAGKRLKTKRA